jgi:hypothetical protein
MAPKKLLIITVRLGTVCLGIAVAALLLKKGNEGGQAQLVEEAHVAPQFETALAPSVKMLATLNSSKPLQAPRNLEKVSETTFFSLTETAKKEIPSVEQIHALPDSAVHFAPVILMRGARALGAVAQALHDNPQLAPAAKEFYQDCALDASYPPSVRALCFADLRKIDASASINLNMPPAVMDLAAHLTVSSR